MKMKFYIFFLILFFLINSNGILFCEEKNNKFDIPISADINIYDVDINSSFDGVNIILFLSINNPNYGFAGKILGPNKKYSVSKRERIFGLWLLKKTIIFEDVPSYYSYFIDDKINKNKNFLEFDTIGYDSFYFQIINKSAIEENEIIEFKKALINYMIKKKLFHESKSITKSNNNLFKINFEIPDNVSSGEYLVNLSHVNIQKDEIDGETRLNFIVKHIDLNKFITNLNYNYPKIYAAFLFLTSIINIFIIRFIIIR